MCILKAWELVWPTLPSISSRAPHETHLPASEQDHVILFMFGRTPRVLWEGISGSVEFVYLRKTTRNSRHDLVSPAMWCECAMEPIGASLAGAAAICQSFLARCPLLASRTGSGLPCAGSEERRLCR